MYDFDAELVKTLPKLKNYAIKLTKDPEQARDLLQDAACKALEYRKSFDSSRSMPAWLRPIVRNCFLQNLKVAKTGKHGGLSEFVHLDDPNVLLEVPSAPRQEQVLLVSQVLNSAQSIKTIKAICNTGSYSDLISVFDFGMGTEVKGEFDSTDLATKWGIAKVSAKNRLIQIRRELRAEYA